MEKQTPLEYIQYLTQDIENAKEKCKIWLDVSVVSHLTYASKMGWLTEEITRGDAVQMVKDWADEKT